MRNDYAVRILCYGDSNVWGWVPNKMGAERYDASTRWTGVLQQKLSKNFKIIEDGLGGHMTVFDDPRPEMPLRNGLALLPIALEAHAPLDIVIIMLGTADCKLIMDLEPMEIANGMKQLIVATRSCKAVNGKNPKDIIVIAPARIKEGTEFSDRIFKGGEQKSFELISLYEQVAKEMGCRYFNADAVAPVDAEEGVHLTPQGHVAIANGLFELITAPLQDQ